MYGFSIDGTLYLFSDKKDALYQASLVQAARLYLVVVNQYSFLEVTEKAVISKVIEK